MRGLIGTLGRMVMVAVAAILIGGCLAAPASARTRDDGVKEANDFVTWCFAMGGEPDVVVDGDMILASCGLPDGTSFNCSWWDMSDWSQECGLYHRVPVGDLPVFEQVEDRPIGGVLVEAEPVQGSDPTLNVPSDNPVADPLN